MKKANFKKMALLGITVGLSVAANASACCGRDKGTHESDSSNDLSVLNKASENFYLAGGGCAPGSCSPKRPPRGTNGNISMADEQPAQGTMMQGGKMQGGEMQGGQMQGGEMQGGQMQGQPQEQQPQQTNPQRKNHNQNGKSSGSCSAALMSSGLNS
jgi:hypothetical protein